MQRHNNHLFNRPISGFSLLELAIVILIVSLVAGGGVMVGQSSLDSTKAASTNNRLATIETALLAFRNVGKRLPCPANGTLTESSANFGVEAAPVGDCVSGTPAANFSATISGSKIAEGVVPVRSLSLPDEYMYDGWGRKFAYAVWVPMTNMRAFMNYGVTFNCGLLSLTDAAGMIRSSQANYVLLSYGKNGHGAYTAQGTKYSSGSVNASEQINCHCDASAADTGYAANYVMKDPTQDITNPLNGFDDIVHYKERWQLQDYNDANNPAGGFTCPQVLPGFRIDGGGANWNSGLSLATGDVNGDGIPDLIIGAPGYNANTGAVFVVFGTKTGFPDPLPLSTLNGSNGFRIDGVAAGDNTGISVAAGDVNGDGIADIIIGADLASPNAVSHAGSVFVVSGALNWPATVALSGMAGVVVAENGGDGGNFFISNALAATFSTGGTNGIRLDGVTANDKVGYAVAAGDVNGDGFADVVIGAPFANANNGKVYTVFGAAAFARSEYTLDNNATTGLIDNAATEGFRIDPMGSTEELGFSVATGDINGDGIADIVMGHSTYNGNAGLVSFVMGKGRGTWSTPIKAINLVGFNGWHAFGVNSGDKAGTSVAIGDVNGDGVGDIVIGAPGASPGGRAGAGATYVLFGHNAYKQGHFHLSNIDGVNGYEIDGITAGDHSGNAVAIGDVNGDGIGDIVIGANAASPGGNAAAGATYVVFGAAAPPGTSFALSALNGTNGFELDGATAGDNTGYAVTTGDINGDGKADLATGGYLAGHGGTASSGSTYVYFGQRRASGWPNPYNLSGL